MSTEFGPCKFYSLQGDCYVFNRPCKECSSINACSDMLRAVDVFVDLFHKSDDRYKSNVLSLLYAKYYTSHFGKD